MKVAVTYKDGEVFQHFGHCEQFMVYTVDDGQVSSGEILVAKDGGHSALATLLKENKVDVVICGGIGGGAQTALAQADIKIFGGVSGRVEERIKEFASGALIYNPQVKCNHFESHHSDEHTHQCHGANGCHHCK